MTSSTTLLGRKFERKLMAREQRLLSASKVFAVAGAMLLSTSAAADAVLINNVRIEVGDGSVITRGSVYISGDKIAKVGKNNSVPRGVRILDAKGGVLTPGFIDIQSTLGVHEVSAEESTVEFQDDRSAFSAGFRPAEAFDPHSVRIPISRQGGITSVVVAPEGGVLSGIGSWALLTGELASRPGVDDDCALFVSLDDSGVQHAGKSRAALWMKLREITADARLYSQKRKDFDRRGMRDLSLSPLHLQAFSRALRGEIAFAARVDKAADILALLDFATWVKSTSPRGKAEKLRVVVVGGAEAWMVRARLAREKVAVVFDAMEDGPHSFARLRVREDAAALLDKAGVPLILYVGGWDENARRLRQVAGNAVAQGLPYERAIKAITQTPSEVFAAKKAKTRRGVIAAGKRADLVLWSADPLELSSVVRVMFIGGRAFDLDSRQDALARRYLRKGPDATRETSTPKGRAR